jgi:ribosomal subunit interface protein
MEVGEALPQHVRDRLGETLEKHFDRGSSATVVFSKVRTGIHVDCHIHLDAGLDIQAEGSGDDAYRAFDQMLKHVSTQAQKRMEKLKDHHEKKTSKDAL